MPEIAKQDQDHDHEYDHADHLAPSSDADILSISRSVSSSINGATINGRCLCKMTYNPPRSRTASGDESIVQDDAEEGTVDGQTAIVFEEA